MNGNLVMRRKAQIKQLAEVAEMIEPVTQPQSKQPVLTPHDLVLLEHARTQWQFGDWDSLTQISLETLQHHPARAELALLAAAGRLQTGENHREARRFIHLAQEWGADKKQINRILISGVYNSLGRAAIVGDQPQCGQKHFEKAITIGLPDCDVGLLIWARCSEQLSQLGLSIAENDIWVESAQPAEPAKTAADTPKPFLSVKNVESLESALNQQKLELDAQFKKQADGLTQVRKFLESCLKKEISNAARQITSFTSLQHYFDTGVLSDVSFEMQGWPVSMDFALYLIELIEFNDYDLIIEFGSGLSTAIIAQAITKKAARRQDKKPVDFVSFDHLEHYYEQTHTRLEQAGLADVVQLVLAPLQDWQASDNSTQPYYSCQATLAALRKKYEVAGQRILVVIDGPPGATCKHARYPAGPLMLEHFTGAYIDLLLDDYIRKDEKEIVQRWHADITAVGFNQTIIERRLEKGACLIRVQGTNCIC